jgi:hypothetical protein
MTTIEVDAGACGLMTRLQAAPGETGVVVLRGESDCPRVQEYLAGLQMVEVSSGLGRCCLEKVFLPAVEAGLHPACLVPVGVIKAVEVVAGLALPRQASIHFWDDSTVRWSKEMSSDG